VPLFVVRVLDAHATWGYRRSGHYRDFSLLNRSAIELEQLPSTRLRPDIAYRRYVLALAAFGVAPLLLFAAFVIAVDPYYVFGSPSWRGFNQIRPEAGNHLLVAKPYQAARMRPRAVALGSSRVETGIDPQHPGWAYHDAFNFALPSSNSYAVMLAFLHAQTLGARQVVVGLDFFGFNAFYQLPFDIHEPRFLTDLSAFVASLQDRIDPVPATPPPPPPPPWDERLYLAVNQDVANAIAGKLFKSGRDHYDQIGRAEGRPGATIPRKWDDVGYLQAHPDVATAIARGDFVSGYHHYLAGGRVEGRLGGFQPPDWDEARYLMINPGAHVSVIEGLYRTGFVHYAAIGKKQDFIGGFAPSNLVDRLRSASPGWNDAIFRLREMPRLLFSSTAAYDAITTVMKQSTPAEFNAHGLRVWHGHDAVLKALGGTGPLIRQWVRDSGGPIWFTNPQPMFCFSPARGAMSTFDPYRFMLRRAYAEGTDLRLFVTPLHLSVRATIDAVGLGERYEFWLKELVRLNEEEAARAGLKPLPLWDFGDANTITSEALPTDTTPMRWFWEASHYRKATGDLILDRIFDFQDPARALPADFGVRVTAANIDAHLAHATARRAAWASGNSVWESIMHSDANRSAQVRQRVATCW